MLTKAYNNLMEGLEDPKAQGFVLDFNLRSEDIYCRVVDIGFSPDDFVIDWIWRFGDDTSADAISMLYAISAIDKRLKGALVNASGIYSESLSEAMIQKLKYTNCPCASPELKR